ncbi:MAG: peptidylprolyl isomerase [Candidatus Micrarchaeota archaeon]|nr:peptidylprolyl isomerase [Candidatus Micrarchaeota archaeon]
MEKNDVVRISFSGKLKETGEKFDEMKNVPVVVGKGYIIKGLDRELEKMNVGEKKTVELKPSDAFGERDPNLIKAVPVSEFRKHNIEPRPGMGITAEGLRGRILSVESGRVRVDFNHPLAGKTLVYEIEVNEKIDDPKEKVKAVVEFYTRIPGEKIQVDEKDGKWEITTPPGIPPAVKDRITKDLKDISGALEVKFSEIYK